MGKSNPMHRITGEEIEAMLTMINMTLANGQRAPHAPASWPFGTINLAGSQHVPRPTLDDLAPDDAPF